jgi:hypothetical protein
MCSRSSVVRFLVWRRALFHSTLSIELEDVDRYGWCPWLLLQLLKLLCTVRGTSFRTRAMGDDGARTRVRIARNSSRTSGERGLDRRRLVSDHGYVNRRPPSQAVCKLPGWASGAICRISVLVLVPENKTKTYLDDFVTEDCIVSRGDGPRRAGEGAVAVAVAARVISWASLPRCLTHLHHSAYCGFYLCFCIHSPRRRPQAARARTQSSTLTLLMTGVARPRPQGRPPKRRGDCRRL